MPALARTMQPGLHRRPDLHRLIHSNTSKTATTTRSRIRKPTIFAIHRLADTPPLQPLRPNPHSARGTAIRSPSRFRPLEAFGRRPPEYVAPPSAAGIRNPQHKQPTNHVRVGDGFFRKQPSRPLPNGPAKAARHRAGIKGLAAERATGLGLGAAARRAMGTPPVSTASRLRLAVVIVVLVFG